MVRRLTPTASHAFMIERVWRSITTCYRRLPGPSVSTRYLVDTAGLQRLRRCIAYDPSLARVSKCWHLCCTFLFVDDEPALRALMAERLGERGFEVVEADSGEKAIQLLEQFAFDVVITDLRMPGIDGTRVIEAALERYPGIVAIVITGYGTMKDAVDAIKRGASDFIAKPFQFDELMHVLQKAIEQRRLRSENAYLRSQLEERYQFGGILGRSRPMRALFQLLETVARSASTILITGETGTGKEVVARAIHHSSPRRAHRFVALNCSAIPETLLEAELFGHVRGAFTGAVGTRQGRIEQAHKGTLFLDEVGTMSTALQMQAAARAAGARVRARRRQPHDQGRRALHRCNQFRPRKDGCRGDVPRRPVLPPQRHSDATAAAARPPRRHSASRDALSREVLRRAPRCTSRRRRCGR